jgi:hypothetical protein
MGTGVALAHDTCARHVCRVLGGRRLGNRVAEPSEQVDHEPRTHPPSGIDPLDLKLVEPGDEPVLVQTVGRRRSAVAVAVPGEVAHVVADEMGGEGEHTPAGAWRRPAPVGDPERVEHVQQACAFEREQRCVLPCWVSPTSHRTTVPVQGSRRIPCSTAAAGSRQIAIAVFIG